MSAAGISVPRGIVARTPEEAASAAAALGASGGGSVVVKSQILAGGRGLGTFKSGFKGGVHVVKVEEAKAVAAKMLGQARGI